MAEWRVYEADDEYISRKAAIAYIREQSEECQKAFEELGGESGIYADAYNDLADNFCSIPAADVAPVRHGRWELLRKGDWTSVFVCSVCGRRETIAESESYNSQLKMPREYPYCHCGAKMDGGDNTER